MAVFNSSLIGLGPSTPYRGRRRSRGTFGHAGGMEDWGQKRGNVMGPFCPTIRLSVRALLAAALFAFLAMAGLANPAAAQGTVKSVHNDWQVRCDTPAGAQAEQCALIQ